MQKTLYVEDDLSLIDGLQYTLETSGYPSHATGNDFRSNVGR